ncbi:hypothetical protein F5144DRAFT_566618 [Chaetomium tenue]|uniref:Uncharacterized protein n=1 Tax=Chaetomium tenue TaxID=1854479 RepID=A0ACB7PGN1_9PEZI|nr:hypothetical protein F5144DRAFT_566618 [Chaetomium globosum]
MLFLIPSMTFDRGIRHTFANDMLEFLDTYGYDSADIDWEYPDAPDRGGNPDDTKNFGSGSRRCTRPFTILGVSWAPRLPLSRHFGTPAGLT